MGLYQIKKFLHKRNCLEIEEAIHRMGENLCQLYIWQGVYNQNIQVAQKTKLPKNQWPNEEIGKWTEQSLFKGKSPNGYKKHMKNAQPPWP
jgi:hypothetical protein